MLSVGETVRILMDEKNINIEQLVKLTGLNKNAILNVIYNRTSRIEYLNKIAKILDIPVEQLSKTKKGYTINLKIYSLAIQIVLEVLQANNIYDISSHILDEYFQSAYDYLSKDTNIENTKSYIFGMITGQMKLGVVKRHK